MRVQWVNVLTGFVCAAMACAASTRSGQVPVAGEGTESGFTRRVTSIVVRDSSGQPFGHPFLGGLNIPRPQLVDIDGDGDLDLFIQEYSGSVMFFERVSPSPETGFVWRTDKFADLDVAEWYRFVDLDHDGDFDLLAESPFSYIRYYRNEGTPFQPRFVLAADTLRDVSGEPIFSDRQNIPNVADIDCDGLLDLFIGRLTGTVMRYEETEGNTTGIPEFRLITDRFEDIEIVAQVGSLHGANTMDMADYDGDGDVDLFWGDFFEPGVLLIENTGTCASPSMRGDPTAFPANDPLVTSGYNAPALGDIDGDGDQDMVVGVLGGAYNPNSTTIDNLYLLEQTAPDEFVSRTSRLITTIDVGSESFPAFADLDGDGDFDLILSNKIEQLDQSTARMYYFENVGNMTQPEFVWRGPWEYSGYYHFAPAFADLDGDGDLDMILGNWRDELAYYRNEGTPATHDFVLVDSAIVKLTRGSNATPALVDIDGDGDLDLFVGESSGTINFYRNVGSSTEPVFELVSDRFDEIDIGRRSVPTFTDIDSDGDYDMIVGREVGAPLLYRNQGSATDPAFVVDSSFSVSLPPFSTPAWVDIDGDGDDDLFSGGIAGGLVLLENRRR
jgi:hypothetical protein